MPDVFQEKDKSNDFPACRLCGKPIEVAVELTAHVMVAGEKTNETLAICTGYPKTCTYKASLAFHVSYKPQTNTQSNKGNVMNINSKSTLDDFMSLWGNLVWFVDADLVKIYSGIIDGFTIRQNTVVVLFKNCGDVISAFEVFDTKDEAKEGLKKLLVKKVDGIL